MQFSMACIHLCPLVPAPLRSSTSRNIDSSFLCTVNTAYNILIYIQNLRAKWEAILPEMIKWKWFKLNNKVTEFGNMELNKKIIWRNQSASILRKYYFKIYLQPQIFGSTWNGGKNCTSGAFLIIFMWIDVIDDQGKRVIQGLQFIHC